MAKKCLNVLCLIMISTLMMCCASKEPREKFDANALARHEADQSAATLPQAAESPDEFIIDPESPEMGKYMEVKVNDFVVILDASGSKYLPYSGKVKLKIAKDVVRRLNQNTPNRSLFGGLRRYGFEAGAWSEKTALLYGMTDYSRQDFANAIEIVRWAGGKSPMAMAIDAASDDFQQARGHYLALVVVSDGKIYQGDAVEAAKRIKQRYGDRICIYTCLVGDLPFGRDLLERVAKAGECGYAITADDLIPDDKMKDWAYDIFHRGDRLRPKKVEKRVAPAKPRYWDLDEALRLKVQFELNKWDILPEYYNGLDRIATLLANKYPEVSIEVHGHTCNIWTEKYNMKLSHLRATEVMKYLMDRGVRANQLVVKGHGLTEPAASNKTEDGRVTNRRAEFRRIR